MSRSSWWVVRLVAGAMWVAACGNAPTSGPVQGSCSCMGRSCGDDGCGRSCGYCGSGQTCSYGICVGSSGPGPCSPSNPSGTCPSGQVCSGGTCTTPGPGPCSASNPSGSCPSGQTCIGGSCCSTSQACGAVCCTSGSLCVRDAAGNRSCAQRCATNSECPGRVGERCCMVLESATTQTSIRDYGACGTFVAGSTLCRCATGSDCGSGACTPSVNADGTPAYPYHCTQPGCAPYGRCTGTFSSCGEGYCNLCDAQGNCFCAQVCMNDAMCGSARCVVYGRSIGSCPNSQMACAPR